MLKKTIKYTDYNGTQREEDFYFNLTQPELLELEYGFDGGLSNGIQRIIDEKNGKLIMKVIRDIILTAFGEKSLDGKRFMKSAESAKAFSETEAYSELFMELATNSEAAAAFINAVVGEVSGTQRPNIKPIN